MNITCPVNINSITLLLQNILYTKMKWNVLLLKGTVVEISSEPLFKKSVIPHLHQSWEL